MEKDQETDAKARPVQSQRGESSESEPKDDSENPEKQGQEGYGQPSQGERTQLKLVSRDTFWVQTPFSLMIFSENMLLSTMPLWPAFQEDDLTHLNMTTQRTNRALACLGKETVGVRVGMVASLCVFSWISKMFFYKVYGHPWKALNGPRRLIGKVTKAFKTRWIYKFIFDDGIKEEMNISTTNDLLVPTKPREILLSILALLLSPIELLFLIVVFGTLTMVIIVMDSFNLSFEEQNLQVENGLMNLILHEAGHTHNRHTWKITGIAMKVGVFTVRGLVLLLALPVLVIVLSVLLFFFPFTIAFLIYMAYQKKSKKPGMESFKCDIGIKRI